MDIIGVGFDVLAEAVSGCFVTKSLKLSFCLYSIWIIFSCPK